MIKIHPKYNKVIELNDLQYINIVTNKGEETVKAISLKGDEWIRRLPSNYINKEYINIQTEIKGGFKSFEMPSILDENLAMFFGMFTADGSMTLKNPKYYYFISFTENHKYRYEELLSLTKKLFRPEEIKTTYRTVKMHGMIYRDFLNSFGVGYPFPNKGVPECIKNSSTNVKCAFIKGLSFDSHFKKNNSHFYLSCGKKNVMDDLLEIFNEMGIYPSTAVKTKVFKSRHSPTHEIIFSNKSLLEYIEKVGMFDYQKNLVNLNNIDLYSARGTYDVVPRDLGLPLYLKCIESKNIKSNHPFYGALLQCKHRNNLNFSRVKLAEFLKDAGFENDYQYLIKSNFTQITNIERLNGKD